MRTFTIALALAALLPASLARSAEPALETDDQKTLYALGVAMSGNLAGFSLTEEELAIVQMGISDGTLGKKPKIDTNAQRAKFQQFAMTRQKAAADKEKKASQEFLAKTEKEDGVTKTDTGLLYKEIKPGTGASPKATDRVKVHYHGTLTDGTVFDSSVERGQPATFPLNGVIPCWTQGVQKMKVGGKSRLVCPSDIAYGDRGAPPKIRPGSTLVFEVELLEIEEAKAPAPPAAPAPGAAGAEPKKAQ
jgi:FKBP-type peptidyl-prolyl cis-trans isomerase